MKPPFRSNTWLNLTASLRNIKFRQTYYSQRSMNCPNCGKELETGKVEIWKGRLMWFEAGKEPNLLLRGGEFMALNPNDITKAYRCRECQMVTLSLMPYGYNPEDYSHP
jgi:predicted RNA-binding Zn-ribbon protein involved in translation (DUF1610 family)